MLKTKIKCIITNDLTIYRTYNGYIPFTSDEIDRFIKDNKDDIDQAIDDIICKYKNIGKIYLLQDLSFNAIEEYLYRYIETPYE